MAQMPWPGATFEVAATKWWTDVVVAADDHYWVDALGNFVSADLEGWWDGALVRPVEVLGYWNGTIASFAPSP
jgi:hypothetical protein